jgi:hypothetical protein
LEGFSFVKRLASRKRRKFQCRNQGGGNSRRGRRSCSNDRFRQNRWQEMQGLRLYDAGGGAPYYIAKMFPYEDTRYDIGGLEHFARSQKSDRPLIQ